MSVRFSRRVFPWMATAGAFLLYAFTRAPGYMPGASAFSLTQALPDSDFPTYGFTLWYSVVDRLDGLPGSLATASTWLAAITGALTVYGLCKIAMGLPLGETAEEQRTPVPEKWLRAVMVGVTLFVALWTLPLWFANTRPFPQAFGLMLITLVGAWTLETFRRRSPAMLNAAAVLWGWMVTETASAWFFLPAFGIAVLMTGFDLSGQFRWGRNLRLLFLFLLGAGLGYLWMSVRVLQHPHAPLQDIQNLGEAFLNSLRVQRNQMRSAAPDRGSLLVLFMFGGPLLVALAPKRQATLDIRIGSILLHTACAVINGWMLFHPAFSPWSLYQSGQLQGLMVVPYAMLALSSGYLAAYWVAVLFKYDPYQPLYLRVPRYGLRLLVLPVLVGVLTVSTVLNILNWKDPYVSEVNVQAEQLAEALGETGLYWGNPGFPSVLRLTLRDKGIDTQMLIPDPVLWSGQPYRNIMAEQFQDIPRLASMAEIGLYPLFTALTEVYPDFTTRFLLADRPDLLLRLGRTPVPVPYGYRGRDTEAESTVPVEQLFQIWDGMDVAEYWDRMGSETQTRRAGHFLVPFYSMESRRANNLGVVLEEQGEVDLAIRAYQTARRLKPGNVSALLNLRVHLKRIPEVERNEVETSFQQLEQAVGDARLDFWRLSSYYGYVRNSEFHLQRGLGWAVTGKPNLAIKEYQRALEQAPTSGFLRLGLADALAADTRPEEAEREYLALLEEDAMSGPALLGLIRLSLSRGQLPEARSYLEQLRETNVDVEIVFQQDIQLTLLEGDLERVEDLAEEWRRSRPNRLTPVLLLMGVAIVEQDEPRRLELEQQASHLQPVTDEERLLYARILILLGQSPQAQGVLQPILSTGPRMVEARTLLLRDAVRRREKQDAMQHVRAILSVEPNHAHANYILGTLHHANGRLDAAVSALRTSLKIRMYPPAANHLAYVLVLQGKPQEALPLSVEATKLSPGAGEHWDTLASVLLELNRPEEAYQAQIQALTLKPDAPTYRLTLARILSALGRQEEVAALVEELFREMESFSVSQRQQLRELAGQR